MFMCFHDLMFLCIYLPPIAQLVEQLPLKQWVLGSNPSGRTHELHGVHGREPNVVYGQ